VRRASSSPSPPAVLAACSASQPDSRRATASAAHTTCSEAVGGRHRGPSATLATDSRQLRSRRAPPETPRAHPARAEAGRRAGLAAEAGGDPYDEGQPAPPGVRGLAWRMGGGVVCSPALLPALFVLYGESLRKYTGGGGHDSTAGVRGRTRGEAEFELAGKEVAVEPVRTRV
jgi:hypothetical protein